MREPDRQLADRLQEVACGQLGQHIANDVAGNEHLRCDQQLRAVTRGLICGRLELAQVGVDVAERAGRLQPGDGERHGSPVPSGAGQSVA